MGAGLVERIGRWIVGRGLQPGSARALTSAFVVALSVAWAAGFAESSIAQGAFAPAASAATPAEIDGTINGTKARFVAQGDDVLISASEAERIGLTYRDGKALSIGGTPLWVVTLASVTVASRTRLATAAGVVPDIAAYFAALRAHPAEAVARSREIRPEINGMAMQAYDLGDAGVLVAPAEADRAGLRYRDGRRQDVGAVSAWRLEALVKRGADKPAPVAVVVAEPEPFFEALMAAARQPK